jgi:NADPH-dependent glutamate synthase beta subunit-like oxidoreductase
MTAIDQDISTQRAIEIVTQWVADFGAALQSGSADALGELLAEDGSWRDFMAFPWDFHHAVGRDEMVEKLISLAKEWNAADFAPSTTQAPVVGNGTINAFMDFTTKDRIDRAYVLLVNVDGRWQADTISSQVVGLVEYPERTRHNRRDGKTYGIIMDRTRWSDDRAKEQSFADEDPAVLILGAGHNGLSIAARLGALEVPTLVIEKEANVGDQWRKRYASLALHSTVFGDHLPYMPLPPNWTAHTPKDKFADFLESYATLMDLNVWTSTTFLNAHYDEQAQRWTVRVRRADGTIKALHPRHFVVAGGLYGVPKIPQVKGIETFLGVSEHSDEFQDSSDYKGKKVLVVGAAVSGHELAHDLYEQGADVTMLQRSSTYVISFAAYHRNFSTLFTEDMPYNPEYADQMTYALPPERGDTVVKNLTSAAAEQDAGLIRSLEDKGFKINYGPDGQGILGAINAGYDSYQINVGCSELIAEGKVKLKQGVEVAEMRDKTVTFTDGTTMEDVDLVLWATGYHQFWGHIKPALGAVGESFDKVYGRAEDGEYANTWRRSAQPGLWFGTGFIRMARFYTQFMALLIKAIEEGIEPYDPNATDGSD